MVDSTLEAVYYEGMRALKMCAVGYQQSSVEEMLRYFATTALLKFA